MSLNKNQIIKLKEIGNQLVNTISYFLANVEKSVEENSTNISQPENSILFEINESYRNTLRSLELIGPSPLAILGDREKPMGNLIAYTSIFKSYNTLFEVLNKGNESLREQRTFIEIVHITESKISDPSFGVAQLAGELGMSRSNLHRKMKIVAKTTAHEFIKSIRLRKALVLITDGSYSISQISYAVGFNDHSYFTKVFKKEFGVPPSAYLPTTQISN